jgi:hypothetical protein
MTITIKTIPARNITIEADETGLLSANGQPLGSLIRKPLGEFVAFSCAPPSLGLPAGAKIGFSAVQVAAIDAHAAEWVAALRAAEKKVNDYNDLFNEGYDDGYNPHSAALGALVRGN